VFNIKATLVATKGAKEGVHHKELPMGIIKFYIFFKPQKFGSFWRFSVLSLG
jgi:hypothetical protein